MENLISPEIARASRETYVLWTCRARPIYFPRDGGYRPNGSTDRVPSHATTISRVRNYTVWVQLILTRNCPLDRQYIALRLVGAMSKKIVFGEEANTEAHYLFNSQGGTSAKNRQEKYKVSSTPFSLSK